MSSEPRTPQLAATVTVTTIIVDNNYHPGKPSSQFSLIKQITDLMPLISFVYQMDLGWRCTGLDTMLLCKCLDYVAIG
jgi:hypothetical protein